MYKDNCIPDPSTKLCPRLVWNGSVDQSWLIKAKQRQAKNVRSKELAENREKRLFEEKRKLETLETQSQSANVKDDEDEEGNSPSEPDKDSTLFTPAKVMNTGVGSSDRITRSTPDSDQVHESIPTMPKIKVRESYKTINPEVIEVLVIIISIFKVDARQAPRHLVYVANNLFGQDWVVLPEKESK